MSLPGGDGVVPRRPAGVRTRGLLVCAVALAAATFPATRVTGQSAAAADSQLEAASAGRVVRLGPGAGSQIRPTAIPLELYVSRVLAGEGESDAQDAAREALAVAIRTYAVANAGRHAREGFDLCDTTHCQVLRVATAATRRATLATAGQILLYEGAPAEVFYSASCGGYSESSAQVWPGSNHPYLLARPVAVHDGDPSWVLELTLDQIERVLAPAGFRGGLRSVRVVERSDSGRAVLLELAGLVPGTIPAERMRALVGATRLQSTAFALDQRGNTVRFTGRGSGHGGGLCVIGAGRRAARGETRAAILERYFPGLVVGQIDRPGLRPASAVAPRPAAAAPEPPRRAGRTVVIEAPLLSAGTADEVEKMAADAHDQLSPILGVSLSPITVRVHDSVEAFRRATGRPWWVRSVSSGTTLDLVPLAAMGGADEWARTIKTAVAELLLAGPLARRPLWVRVGAARFFSRDGSRPTTNDDGRCPSDSALTDSVSAVALREAEAHAEACFASRYARTRDWRTVR